MLLEDDNDFAQLLSSTGFHKKHPQAFDMCFFCRKKINAQKLKLKLKEVVSVPVAVGEEIGVRDSGFCCVDL